MVKEGIEISEGTRLDCVSSLFSKASRSWNMEKLRTLFNPSIVMDILKTTLGAGNSVDKRVWGFERSSLFSVRSYYQFILDQ